jgi:hypothetical protein
MIQMKTLLNVADNSGAKLVQCIKVLGGTRRKYARIGDIIVVAVKDALPNAAIKKGGIEKAVVVRTHKELHRPDEIGTPVLSTSRPVRQDYFGMGAANAAYFYIPINVPGGTGPYRGRFGTLGRNTFNGPPLRTFDVALSKEINLAKGLKLQSRAEFYNVFNIVNFSTPNNVLTGSGFGMITSTSSNSRQLQFSLKLVY